jgi:hypothetical protein
MLKDQWGGAGLNFGILGKGAGKLNAGAGTIDLTAWGVMDAMDGFSDAFWLHEVSNSANPDDWKYDDRHKGKNDITFINHLAYSEASGDREKAQKIREGEWSIGYGDMKGRGQADDAAKQILLNSDYLISDGDSFAKNKAVLGATTLSHEAAHLGIAGVHKDEELTAYSDQSATWKSLASQFGRQMTVEALQAMKNGESMSQGLARDIIFNSLNRRDGKSDEEYKQYLEEKLGVKWTGKDSMSWDVDLLDGILNDFKRKTVELVQYSAEPANIITNPVKLQKWFHDKEKELYNSEDTTLVQYLAFETAYAGIQLADAFLPYFVLLAKNEQERWGKQIAKIAIGASISCLIPKINTDILRWAYGLGVYAGDKVVGGVQAVDHLLRPISKREDTEINECKYCPKIGPLKDNQKEESRW